MFFSKIFKEIWSQGWLTFWQVSLIMHMYDKWTNHSEYQVLENMFLKLIQNSLISVFFHNVDLKNMYPIQWNKLKYSFFVNRHIVAMHRPFCVDLQETTFATLRSFLEHYCHSFGTESPPAPFKAHRCDINKFSLSWMCMLLIELLCQISQGWIWYVRIVNRTSVLDFTGLNMVCAHSK